MELYEEVFETVMEFNDFVNIALISEDMIITPISVLKKGAKLQIFYTKESAE
jgi:hypothetical protein